MAPSQDRAAVANLSSPAKWNSPGGEAQAGVYTCASPTISNQRREYGPEVDTSGLVGQLESGIEGSDYQYCITTPGAQNGDAMILYSCDYVSSALWSKPSP